jgi:PAS domain S-box-containing protein
VHVREVPAVRSAPQHDAQSGRSRLAARLLAGYAAAASLVTLTGWITGSRSLTSWFDDIAMFMNTSIAGLITAVAILLLTLRRRRAAAILAGFAGLIGLATLLEHATGWNLGIDTLLFSHPWGPRGANAPGRMGPPASVSFSLLGAALIIASTFPRARRVAPFLALAVTLISGLSLIGYLFGADELYAAPRWTGISLATCTVLMALSLGLLTALSDLAPISIVIENSAAGVLTRRALPFIIVLPIALGWLRVRGQQMALYDAEMGVALLVVVLVLMLAALLWWAAAALHSREAALREQDDVFRTMFEITSVGMAKADPKDGRLLRVNQTFCDLLGEPEDNLLGRSFIEFTHPDDRQHNREQFQKLIRGEIATYHVEKRFLRPDRSIVWAEVTANLVRDASGKPLRTVAVIQDVTQRRRTEQALTRRAVEQSVLYRFTDRLHRAGSLEQVYDAALDAIIKGLACSRASIFLFDEGGVMRFVGWRGLSDAYRTAVEGHAAWTPEAPEPQPITIQDIRTSDVPPALRDTIDKEGIAALAFIPLVADGRVIGKFMACHDTPHAFTPDELSLAITIARQLAFGIVRRRAEQALQESEERLRLATLGGKVGIWEWNIPSDRLVWTPSLYDIHGIGRDGFSHDIAGFNALVHPEDRLRVSQALDRALKHGDPLALEFRAVRPDGRPAWLFTNAITFRENGRPVRILGATLDITDQKAAQTVLAESELFFRTLGEAVPDFLWMTDAAGRPLYLNPAWRHYSGRSADELSGRGCESLIHPDEARLMRFQWEQAIATSEAFEFEGRLRRFDGAYRWFMGRTIPVKDEHGRVLKWVGTLTDIHDRKQLEAERDQHAAELALALAHRTEQVTRAQQRLAANDRLAAVGTLAAGLGHDLSNLLLPLTVRLDSIKVRHDLPEDVRADIDAAEGLIAHLRALARNLRLFVRDPAQAGLESKTDLADWSDRTRRFLGVVACGGAGPESPDVSLEYQIPPDLPAVAIAPHQLTQAVTNLVHNAREAILARRAEDPETTPGLITIGALAEPGEVRLWVSDNGCGMSDDIRRRCMEPFFTTRDRPAHGESARAGTGIGLATVYAAVTQARGRIEIDSQPGRGTTFTLHLPSASPKLVPTSDLPPPPRTVARPLAHAEAPHTEPKPLPSGSLAGSPPQGS